MIYASLPQKSVQNYLVIGDASFDYRLCMPNSIREALLSQGLGDAALVLDALYAIGFKAGRIFTVQTALYQLGRVGIEAGEMLVRRGLNSGVFATGKILSRKKGRPMVVYHMPEMKKLCDRYCDGFWSAADPLDIDAFRTLADYRKQLHLGLIKRSPGIYSRFFLSQRLGISKRTIRNYDRQLDIVSERRSCKQKLHPHLAWEAMIKGAKAGANWLQIQFRDGTFLDTPLRIGIVWKYIHRWQDVEGVYLVTQLCNRYKLGNSHLEMAF